MINHSKILLAILISITQNHQFLVLDEILLSDWSYLVRLNLRLRSPRKKLRAQQEAYTVGMLLWHSR